MTSNLFEAAIEKDEIDDFFKGKNKYFVPSQDYEGHVHGAHMGGCARVYAEKSKANTEAFDKALLQFLNSLEVSREDLNDLLANLSSFFAQKNRGGFNQSRLFESKESMESSMLYDYLNKIYQSSFSEEVKDQINRHAKFANKKGNSLLADIAINLWGN